MVDKAFNNEKRGTEEEYFHKQEFELIDKMRRQAERDAERLRMAEAVGVNDPNILDTLLVIGYTHETARILYLLPLIQVAWADGHVNYRERKLIHERARSQRVEKNDPAYQELTQRLARRSSEEFFQLSLRLIRRILQELPQQIRESRKREIVSCCKEIAEVSHGIGFLGRKICWEERIVLERISAHLEMNHEAA